MEGKATFTVDYNGKSFSVKGNVKIQKDSCIIISIQPIIGIEAGRLQATKNNIIVIDRMHSTYYQATYNDIKSMTGVALDYETLQAVLSNELFLTGVDEKKMNANMFEIKASANGHQLKSNLPATQCPYLFDFYIDTNYKLTQTIITERLHANIFSCKYSNFLQTEKCQFPYNMELSVFDGKQSGKLNINFSKIEIDKNLNINLSVPSKYKAGDISKLNRLF